MAKAAIYCRVSSDEQAEKGTIEGQVQYAKKYMELHGLEACIEEYEFYLDEGVSGTLPLAERPAGAKLIADAKAGKFKALYVYRLDRLARSVKHVAKDIEDAVWLDIVAFAKNPGRIIEIMQERIKQNSKDLTPVKNEINEVEKAILDKQTARGKVLSLCARGIITDQEAETELQSLAREMEALTSRRGHLFSRMDAAQKVETETLTAQAMLDTLAERIDNLSDKEKAEVIRGITRRVNVYTLVNEEGKRYTKAEIHYLFEKNSCMELSISRNSYNHTTLLDVETTWLFKPYNRSKGTRVRLN